MSSRLQIKKLCEHCDEEFIAKTTVTKYCSHKCNQRAYKAKKRQEKIENATKQTTKKRVAPIEVLKAKEILTVKEVAKLLNCSVRTVYYYIDEGTIKATNLGQRLTRVMRSEIDKIFEKQIKADFEKPTNTTYKIEDCYNLTEVQSLFGISEKALHNLIIRESIPKMKEGWYAYVPKEIIETHLTKIDKDAN